ncbi:50S ribosomal protein L21 [bacterium]|nr:50S ribosomal protein L21 [bacterium]
MSEEGMSEEKAAPYAVFQVGNHHHKVRVGDRVAIEWGSEKELEKESEITFNEVLLQKGADTAAVIGTPLVDGATVTGKVIGEAHGDKVTSYKKTRRHGYHKKKGHRQQFLEIEVTGV